MSELFEVIWALVFVVITIMTVAFVLTLAGTAIIELVVFIRRWFR